MQPEWDKLLYTLYKQIYTHEKNTEHIHTRTHIYYRKCLFCGIENRYDTIGHAQVTHNRPRKQQQLLTQFPSHAHQIITNIATHTNLRYADQKSQRKQPNGHTT